jgi:hypothetical protein
VQAGTVLSEVLASPGPTHTLFDVLAAAIAALTPGPRVALLGFAAGGVVAPLRAMGFPHPLDAVDLSLEGEALFRELSTSWAGRVRLKRADAARWLARKAAAYDLILEDLFSEQGRVMVKPEVSFAALPSLMRRALTSEGVVVVNTLPVPGVPWRDVLGALAAPFEEACAIELQEYENRLLVAGRSLGGPHAVSGRVRSMLRRIGSRQAERVSVRALLPGGLTSPWRTRARPS